MNTILQKQIEQAARKYGCDAYIEYCRQHGVDAATAKYPSLENAFITGAEWMLQNMWISVDEELPTENRILAKLSPSFCGREDYLEILHRIPIEMVDLKHPLGYYDCCGESVPTSAITHWMEIQSLEGGEE